VKANPNRFGVVLAAVIGGWHLLWSGLVLLEWAQPVLDFIFWAHMIKPVYLVQAFNPAAAATLIVVTSGMGYFFGFAAALIWNRLH
jgi:hypothetical protein